MIPYKIIPPLQLGAFAAIKLAKRQAKKRNIKDGYSRPWNLAFMYFSIPSYRPVPSQIY